jgi:hypothetical protein
MRSSRRKSLDCYEVVRQFINGIRFYANPERHPNLFEAANQITEELRPFLSNNQDFIENLPSLLVQTVKKLSNSLPHFFEVLSTFVANIEENLDMLENLFAAANYGSVLVLGTITTEDYTEQLEAFGEIQLKRITQSRLQAIYNTPYVQLVELQQGSLKILHKVPISQFYQNFGKVKSVFDKLLIEEFEFPGLISSSFANSKSCL